MLAEAIDQMVPALIMAKILLLRLLRPGLNWLETCSLLNPLRHRATGISYPVVCNGDC